MNSYQASLLARIIVNIEYLTGFRAVELPFFAVRKSIYPNSKFSTQKTLISSTESVQSIDEVSFEVMDTRSGFSSTQLPWRLANNAKENTRT